MQGRFIRKGGVFNARTAPAEYYGAPVTKLGSRPITGPNYGPPQRLGFRFIGPFAGNETAYAQPPYPPSAEAYGREAGVFYRSARRCAVDESVMPGDVTPRGGIFDGATVGGPGCTYISPPPQVIPQLRPAEVPVPQLRPPQTEVAFQKVNLTPSLWER